MRKEEEEEEKKKKREKKEGNGRLLFPLSNSEYVIAILSCSSNCGKIPLDVMSAS